jgi:hypothetical protein
MVVFYELNPSLVIAHHAFSVVIGQQFAIDRFTDLACVDNAGCLLRRCWLNSALHDGLAASFCERPCVE